MDQVRPQQHRRGQPQNQDPTKTWPRNKTLERNLKRSAPAEQALPSRRFPKPDYLPPNRVYAEERIQQLANQTEWTPEPCQPKQPPEK